MGVMIKNVIGFSFKDEYNSFSLPRYFTVGISKDIEKYLLSLDSEYIYGTISGEEKKDVEIWFIRGGFEMEIGSWIEGRIGIIYPVIARTSTMGNLKNDMPSPKMGGSIGLGFKYKPFIVDFSIYGDPARSYVEQKAVISSVVSVTLEY